MQTTHFIANGGIQTAYNDEGTGDPFLLVHGFTGSKLDFSNALPWFAETHRVLAYDQRGHGESSNLGPYSLYSLASDLLSFLDQLEIEQCHILGHSLGGMVTMQAMISQPKRFSSAILMDTAPYPVGLFDEPTRARLNAMVEEHGCEGLVAGMRGQPQPPAVQRGIDYLGEQEHWRRIRTKLEQMDTAAFVELGAVLADHPPVLAALSHLDIPTTIIVGADDKPFLKPSREMADSLANAQLEIIEDAAHSPQYENHAVWRDVVEAHLARVA